MIQPLNDQSLNNQKDGFEQNLDFCKFKIPTNSGRVIWEVTNECNYGCKYCIFSSTGRKPQGELNTQKIIETLNSLYSQNFRYIKFTGGEPFLRDDMIDILETAVGMGFKCDISTNASKITDELAKRISNINLEFVHVSVDGHTQEIHESVRGKKSFYPTIEGIKKLSSYPIKIRIGCVLHLKNENHIEDMYHYFKTFHASEVVFSMMENVGRLKGRTTGMAIQSPEKLMKIIDSIYISNFKVSHNLKSLVQPIVLKKDILLINKNCPGAERFLFINSLGVVSPCTWVSERAPQYIGKSLHNQSLQKILTSLEFKQFNEFKKVVGSLCPMEKIK